MYGKEKSPYYSRVMLMIQHLYHVPLHFIFFELTLLAKNAVFFFCELHVILNKHCYMLSSHHNDTGDT